MSEVNDRLMRPKEVCEMLGGISITTLWRLEKQGRMPQKIRIGRKCVGWWYSEIKEKLKEQPDVPEDF